MQYIFYIQIRKKKKEKKLTEIDGNHSHFLVMNILQMKISAYTSRSVAKTDSGKYEYTINFSKMNFTCIVLVIEEILKYLSTEKEIIGVIIGFKQLNSSSKKVKEEKKIPVSQW